VTLFGRFLPLGMSCAALCFLAAPCALSASPNNADSLTFRDSDSVDNSELMHDLALTHGEAGRLTMTLWLPDEFWRTQLKHRGAMTDRGIDNYLAVVHPYTLVAVLDGQLGITAYRYTDAETLANEVTLEDSHGERYAPLPPESISEDVRNMIQMFRPLLANMMGAMGQHMEFLVFPSLDKAGRPLADPRGSGAMNVHVGDVSMRYRLPLGSLLVQAVDGKTGESFPGGYRFNPFTGDKLVPRAPPLAPPAAPPTPRAQ
jgi:hypothetical protein